MAMAIQQRIERAREVVPRSVTFLQEAWAELKKVHWPSRREVVSSTVVVLVLVFVVALFLGLVDYAATQLVRLVLAR
ncbi:MAG: hypothetical protein KatS3mg076_0707 [Candidatus Binatia bacterium]|nr:MAG: hypothetical protein KatS3mg076_0707 [Candidatus Binatia bacterium]